jgi:hypothetical protein
LNLRKKFSEVYSRNLFFGFESRSGRGSGSEETQVLRKKLPSLLKQLNVSTVLDAPCGDMHWIKDVNLNEVSYTGADIVPELVDTLSRQFSRSGREFLILDVVQQQLPRAFDAIFCRDLLVHLSTKQIVSTIRNFKASGSKYLITTHFTGNRTYKNLPTFSQSVGWRPLNLTLEPFSFPEPMAVINEECTEGNGKFRDKSIAVWLLDELNI